MSLWGRLLGNRRNRACAEGVNLLEQGRYSEAVELLRQAALDSSDHPTGSLASFHFRSALVAQGRRHLRAGEYAEAAACLDEAVKLWDQYPDLHCLLGAALGMSGEWDDALSGARAALRRNADYAEARLLETVSLQKLDRQVEAADSLNSLVESGRRVEHWLIRGLEGTQQFGPSDLPDDLEKLLMNSLSGQSEKEEVAAAVAQCRAGHWEEGLERFGDLVRKRPRYPDYRTRHSAALFHLGRNEEALAEVEAALALNENYRTAINLKGLILADAGRLREARDFLDGNASAEVDGKSGGAHEELFGSYLRGVLALLSGDARGVLASLGSWGSLSKNFARAELLLAAAEDLLGRDADCGRRLSDLAEEWTAEPIYFFLLASHYLNAGRFEEAAGVLGRWPAGAGDPDNRPLYLEANLALGQGRIPDLTPSLQTENDDPGSRDDLVLKPAAWSFLEAKVEILKGNPERTWVICGELAERGYHTESLARLRLAATAGLSDEMRGDWQPPAVLPDSCLPGAVNDAVNRDDPVGLAALLSRYRDIHPEQIRALWLSPSFWLDPVRNWIA